MTWARCRSSEVMSVHPGLPDGEGCWEASSPPSPRPSADGSRCLRRKLRIDRRSTTAGGMMMRENGRARQRVLNRKAQGEYAW